MKRKTKELVAFTLFRLCAAIVVFILVVLVGYVVMNGIGVVDLDFLTQFPSHIFTEGGILGALVGTIYLIGLVLVIAVPIGVLTAVYLVEYSDQPLIDFRHLFSRIRNRDRSHTETDFVHKHRFRSKRQTGRGRQSRLFYRILRIVITNLAGVPSIVFGLLGLGMLVYFLHIGFSLIASAITLAFMVLPLVITASREAMEAVPGSIREASLALGTSKWQTVRSHVLPYSLPGILTGVILSLSRAAGETAPILLTGVVLLKNVLPSSIFDTFQALPFQLYALATQFSSNTRPMQYGLAFVLLVLVIIMNLAAIIIRNRYRKKYRW